MRQFNWIATLANLDCDSNRLPLCIFIARQTALDVAVVARLLVLATARTPLSCFDDCSTHCSMHHDSIQLFFVFAEHQSPRKTDSPFTVKASREEGKNEFRLDDQLLPYRVERELMSDFRFPLLFCKRPARSGRLVFNEKMWKYEGGWLEVSQLGRARSSIDCKSRPRTEIPRFDWLELNLKSSHAVEATHAANETLAFAPRRRSFVSGLLLVTARSPSANHLLNSCFPR